MLLITRWLCGDMPLSGPDPLIDTTTYLLEMGKVVGGSAGRVCYAGKVKWVHMFTMSREEFRGTEFWVWQWYFLRADVLLYIYLQKLGPWLPQGLVFVQNFRISGNVGQYQDPHLPPSPTILNSGNFLSSQFWVISCDFNFLWFPFLSMSRHFDFLWFPFLFFGPVTSKWRIQWGHRGHAPSTPIFCKNSCCFFFCGKCGVLPWGRKRGLGAPANSPFGGNPFFLQNPQIIVDARNIMIGLVPPSPLWGNPGSAPTGFQWYHDEILPITYLGVYSPYKKWHALWH